MKIVNESYVITSKLQLANAWWRECEKKNRVFVAVLVESRSKYAEVHYDTFTKEVHVSDALNIAGMKFVLHYAWHFKTEFTFSENNGWFKKIHRENALELAQAFACLFTIPSIFTSLEKVTPSESLFEEMSEWDR